MLRQDNLLVRKLATEIPCESRQSFSPKRNFSSKSRKIRAVSPPRRGAKDDEMGTFEPGLQIWHKLQDDKSSPSPHKDTYSPLREKAVWLTIVGRNS